MHIWSRELGPYSANCYIIACPETCACAVVDPGTPDSWIQNTLAEHNLTPSAIILTHGHVDHIGGVQWLKAQTGAPVWMHRDDADMVANPQVNLSVFAEHPIALPQAERYLEEGETLSLGTLALHVLHTPGHSPGGICLYTPGHLIAGDTLFAGSIGRSDLRGGNFEQLIHSIRTKLLPLPPDTVVYPGHGPTTTVGDEKEYNPFL